MKTVVMAALAAFTFGTQAFAHDYQIGDLTIAHPMSFETAETARTGASYMTITNTGTTDDRLVEARADFPRVEVHEILRDGDVMQMRQLEQGLIIPAGEAVTLEPGGYHVMYMGVTDNFEVGDEFPLTLVFEQAGEIEVTIKVEARMGEAMDHGDMDHGDGHGDDHDHDHGEMEMEEASE